MELEKIALITMLILFVSGLVVAQSYSFNGSEPRFLKDIGPKDPRLDNPWAALAVTLGVGAILYVGFKNIDSMNDEET